MLLDKYRPNRLEELVGNRKQALEIKAWLGNHQKGRAMIVFGQPGTGKTLAVRLGAHELGIQLLEICDESEVNDVVSSAGQQGFSGKKAVLAENIGMRGISKILSAVDCPVIIILDDPYDKKFYNLRKKSKLVKFFRINTVSINSFLKKVCRAEGIKYDEDALQQMSKMSGGDIRSVLIDLETLSDGVTIESVKTLGFRAVEENVFETMKIIFKSTSMESVAIALSNSDKPQEELFSWVCENIPHEYEAPWEIASAYEHMANADVFRSRILRRQSWSLQKYAFLGIHGAALSKDMPYRKFYIYKSPFFASSKLNTVLEKISGFLGVSKKTSFHYLTLVKHMATDPETAKIMGFESSELKVLEAF